jgi:hypothetical protein
MNGRCGPATLRPRNSLTETPARCTFKSVAVSEAVSESVAPLLRSVWQPASKPLLSRTIQLAKALTPPTASGTWSD